MSLLYNSQKVVAIVMDVFTDVDIFKEVVDASLRGVAVYMLLDDFHLHSFLSMAENQDIKIQQLRNMRVRTVKGQDYLCRSGAKFHGAMQQKFLLADCQTVVYGSYSFTWSFEKINLSMVQVITGHLVESYDEEFRTLYARSTVPAELCPSEGLLQVSGPNGRQMFPNYVSHSAPKFERKDQLRHTLDTVYRKACERHIGMRDLEERLYEEEPIKHRPLIDNGMYPPNQMPQFQSPETMNFLKRHSYAGERQETNIPENARYRASNWNISREAGFLNGRNNYPILSEKFPQGPQMYKGQNMHPSYHSNDKQVLSMKQGIPTLENATKSYMRTWRIESYLKNPDTPYESCDYLDQYEPPDNKANSFMQGRMRSSLVFRSVIPEQMETNSYTNSSTGVCQADTSTAPNTALHYSSMQWNPRAAVENRRNNEEFRFKRQSLQILDDDRNNISYSPGRNAIYASLGEAKGMITKPDILTDNWYKRHSVADPRSNTEYDHESSSHMYGGAFARRPVNRTTAGFNAQNGGYGSNLNEDQRSVSQFDVKSITSTKSPSASIWQEPPSRTVSAAALDVNSKELTAKSTSMSSPHFLKKSSKKIRSLLNIPEKKEVSRQTLETASSTSGGSTDTLTAEDDEKKSDWERSPQKSTAKSSSLHQRNQFADDHLKSSIPRFITEECHQPNSLSKTVTQTRPSAHDKYERPSVATGNSSRDRGADSRLHSRLESSCTFENKHSSRFAKSSLNTHSQERVKSMLLSKGDSTTEHSLGRAARGHHDNKLGKFIQKVGNFIHKGK
ncbi:protein FAM83B isoform X2 [Myripristis murdjan]|uniref:protein FAM83B isoform X2 n=1 Tax=Myripristis murdjan TaxID=586833 RepID=UPI00117605DD|nr:protein FAM83B isoform X2 [Myripristis murdjan]